MADGKNTQMNWEKSPAFKVILRFNQILLLLLLLSVCACFITEKALIPTIIFFVVVFLYSIVSGILIALYCFVRGLWDIIKTPPAPIEQP